MNRKKAVFSILIIVQIVFAIVMATYGWVTNTQTPEIKETEIKVFKTTGLIMTLDGENVTDVVDLKTILASDGRSFDNFVLRQASSLSGAVGTFYTRDTTTVENITALRYIKAISTAEDVTQTYENSHYIEFKFFLETQDEDRYIFLEPERDSSGNPIVDPDIPSEYYSHNHSGKIYKSKSFITSEYQTAQANYEADTYKAIRTSITITHGSTESITDPTTIFGVIPEDEVPNSTKAYGLQKTVAVLGEGEIDNTNLTAKTQYVRLFGDFAGDPADMTTFLPISSQKNGQYNYVLSPGDRVMVTVRIWLEGGSEYCVSDRLVSNTLFKIRIQFGSIKVSAVNGG